MVLLELCDADWAFLRGVLREYAESKTGQGKLGQVSNELFRFHMARAYEKQNGIEPDAEQTPEFTILIDDAIKKEPASTEAEFKDIVYLKKANIQEWARDSVKNFIEVNFDDIKSSVNLKPRGITSTGFLDRCQQMIQIQLAKPQNF